MWTYLGIDWGTKKTGFALGSPDLKLVVPKNEVIATGQVMDYVAGLIKSNPIEVIVIGLPLTLALTKTATTEYIEAFGLELKTNYPKLSIIYHNERGSSKVTAQKLRSGGLDNRKVKNYDSLAASEILQNYFREAL
jgi:putative holliday junction resolvase